MQKKFKISLFLFRRDLRLEDNTALIAALKESEIVIPAFILTPEQIERNPYRSDHCLKFMIESLKDLDLQLKKKGTTLYLFHGKPEEILRKCISNLDIQALFINRDYTPYSKQRDKKLEKLCNKQQIAFYSYEDALLHPPEVTLKKDGKPYTIFTPYFRHASKFPVVPPTANRATNYYQRKIAFAEQESILDKLLPDVHNCAKGGRNEALKILKKLKDRETHLSPYLKFTVCSPREVYKAFKQQNKALIRALYWRDFFTCIAYFFPHVFKGAFRPKFDNIRWSRDKKSFKRWCRGLTGFPIVDAGMREMNEMGYMPNRIRMIVASFLVKDLYIDWKWGEKYFAQTLIDYDPAVNNGNWQWCASTGCDAHPYFRIFNPWTQQKKFDPDCTYIKKWIPELRDVEPGAIHSWYEKKVQKGNSSSYPVPMVDHDKAAKKAISLFRNSFEQF